MTPARSKTQPGVAPDHVSISPGMLYIGTSDQQASEAASDVLMAMY
jgi:hypothetical protein